MGITWGEEAELLGIKFCQSYRRSYLDHRPVLAYLNGCMAEGKDKKEAYEELIRLITTETTQNGTI